MAVRLRRGKIVKKIKVNAAACARKSGRTGRMVWVAETISLCLIFYNLACERLAM
jgi:hypothetical protein